MFGWFKPRCYACGSKLEGLSLQKTVKMANGSWKSLCGKCWRDAGSPGRLPNKVKSMPQEGQGTLW